MDACEVTPASLRRRGSLRQRRSSVYLDHLVDECDAPLRPARISLLDLHHRPSDLSARRGIRLHWESFQNEDNLRFRRPRRIVGGATGLNRKWSPPSHHQIRSVRPVLSQSSISNSVGMNHRPSPCLVAMAFHSRSGATSS